MYWFRLRVLRAFVVHYDAQEPRTSNTTHDALVP